MPRTVTVNVGLSRRPDNHGNATQSDATAIAAVQHLFDNPIKMGWGREDLVVKLRCVGLPKGNVQAVVDKIESKRAAFNFADSFSAQQLDGIDLLYIPGAPVASPTQATNTTGTKATSGFKATEAKSRDPFEARLIEAAMARGIPILAVCAGSWRLLEAFGGQVRELSSDEIGTHYGGGFNQNHGLHVLAPSKSPGVVTSASMPFDPKKQGHQGGGLVFSGANSTHWAVAKTTSGDLAKRPESAKLNRTSDKLDPSQLLSISAKEPSTGTVEAFESKHGAPIVGAQWHPESFLPTMKGLKEAYANKATIGFSQNIFQLMVLAAVAAKTRRCEVIPQLKLKLSGRLHQVESTPGAVSKNF